MKFIGMLKDKKLIRGHISLGIVNLVFDKAIKRESLYLLKHRSGHLYAPKSTTSKDRVNMQRMSYNAFKLALADLAQRQSKAPGLSSRTLSKYVSTLTGVP